MSTAYPPNFGTGWGKSENHGNGLGTKYLNQVYLEWVEQAVCEEDMGSRFIPEEMICAGDVQHGGRDTCQVSLSLLPSVIFFLSPSLAPVLSQLYFLLVFMAVFLSF